MEPGVVRAPDDRAGDFMTSTLFVGGSAYTMDPAQPWAQAVLVQSDRIVFVGSEAEARVA